MRAEGIFAEQIAQSFKVACRKAGLDGVDRHDLSVESFRRPQGAQLSLWQDGLMRFGGLV